MKHLLWQLFELGYISHLSSWDSNFGHHHNSYARLQVPVGLWAIPVGALEQGMLTFSPHRAWEEVMHETLVSRAGKSERWEERSFQILPLSLSKLQFLHLSRGDNIQSADLW